MKILLLKAYWSNGLYYKYSPIEIKTNKMKMNNKEEVSYFESMIRIGKELLKNKGFENGYGFKHIEDKHIEKLKKILSNKEDFLILYRKMCGLNKEGDIFDALKNKMENDKKSILNNSQCEDKKDKLKDIDKLYIEHIKELKELLDYDWKNSNLTKLNMSMKGGIKR